MGGVGVGEGVGVGDGDGDCGDGEDCGVGKFLYRTHKVLEFRILDTRVVHVPKPTMSFGVGY